MVDKQIIEELKLLNLIARSLEYSSESTVEIDEDGWFGLLFTGDWHLEHTQCDISKLEEDLKVLQRVSNVYCVFCGDGSDWHNIALTHLGGANESLLTARMTEIVQKYLFSLIRDKLICAVAGCHDLWVQRLVDHNPIQTVMREFGVEYLGSGGILKIDIGSRVLNCLIQHKGEGYSIYNRFHPCMRAVRFGDYEEELDIVAIAHSHISAVGSECFRGINRYYFRVGTYKRSSRWANKQGYAPTPVGLSPWVILHPEHDGYFLGQGILALADGLKKLNK